MTALRKMLAPIFGDNARLLNIMEKAVVDAGNAAEAVTANVAATVALDQATVLTLSPNTAFGNERVLALGRGLVGAVGLNSYTLHVSDAVPAIEGGFTATFTVAGQTSVTLPVSGQLATTGNPETLKRKTLDAPSLSGLVNAANDAAAATAGVPVGGIYRDSSTLKVRVS